MKTRDRVLSALAQSSLTKGGLESALSISNSAARRAVQRLIERGHIKVSGSAPARPSKAWRGGRHWKVYTITAAGQAHLALTSAADAAPRAISRTKS